MKGTQRVLWCDGDCGAMTVDFWAETVSSVNGIPITVTARAPGWVSTPVTDLCPDHAPQLTESKP